MDREQQKLVAMRERAEARRDRFLNARQRTIGVDVGALNQQMAEKEARDEDESAASESRYMRERYIATLIEQREAEEREMKRRELRDLKSTWDEQAARPKNQVAKRGTPIDPRACGPAALQGFRGEDEASFDRARLQKEQMRSWSTQQTAENAARKEEATEAEARYAAYVKMLTERRGVMEQEEAMAAKEWRLRTAAENGEIEAWKASQKAASRRAEFGEKVQDVQYQMSSVRSKSCALGFGGAEMWGNVGNTSEL
jgi:hypothetical protein